MGAHVAAAAVQDPAIPLLAIFWVAGLVVGFLVRGFRFLPCLSGRECLEPSSIPFLPWAACPSPGEASADLPTPAPTRRHPPAPPPCAAAET